MHSHWVIDMIVGSFRLCVSLKTHYIHKHASYSICQVYLAMKAVCAFTRMYSFTRTPLSQKRIDIVAVFLAFLQFLLIRKARMCVCTPESEKERRRKKHSSTKKLLLYCHCRCHLHGSRTALDE